MVISYQEGNAFHALPAALHAQLLRAHALCAFMVISYQEGNAIHALPAALHAQLLRAYALCAFMVISYQEGDAIHALNLTVLFVQILPTSVLNAMLVTRVSADVACLLL
jgi:hypothetical protein